MLSRFLVATCLGVVLVGGCEPRKATPAAPKVQTRQTIGKTTQIVLELANAIADGGVPADMSIGGGGLEVVADGYRASAGKLAVIAVEQKMKLHEAEHGSMPKSHAEFMKKIIEPGSGSGLHLPMLPFYQEYAYDAAKRRLVVVEYPDRKAQRERETTGPSGL